MHECIIHIIKLKHPIKALKRESLIAGERNSGNETHPEGRGRVCWLSPCSKDSMSICQSAGDPHRK